MSSTPSNLDTVTVSSPGARGAYLHTGELDLSSGALRIIDRKKNMFKLSQGEYIAPDRLECVYSKAAVVEQVRVCVRAYVCVRADL